jgi:CRISPR-associated exonuclease Cas4
MLSVTTIENYLNGRNISDFEENKVYNLNKSFVRKLRLDIEDLILRNARKVNKSMSWNEIAYTISKGVHEYINDDIHLEKTSEDNNLAESVMNLQLDTDMMISGLSTKLISIMNRLSLDGKDALDHLIPTSMFSYLIRDTNLELIGKCDKIEIQRGRYFPVNYSDAEPPVDTYYNSDAIVLCLNALLIEQEFDTEVFAGFIHYTRLNERRTVVMDSKLRKEVFKTIHEIKEILEGTYEVTE